MTYYKSTLKYNLNFLQDLQVRTNMKTSHANSIPDSQEIVQFNDSILEWYDKNARILPWRARQGAAAKPYYVWLSEIMLQQTTVTAVKPYFEKFIRRWPEIADLANAESVDVMDMWAGLGYYSRARNLHKCAQQIVEKYDGDVPREEKALLGLAGVGPYTAGAIGSIAFNQPRLTIDGNIERVFARYHNVQTYMPEAKKELSALIKPYMCDEQMNPQPSAYVQALMDLGATVCQPKKVQCGLCPLSTKCAARMAGHALELPRKKPKSVPQREAICFIVSDDNNERILIERRPDKGLLAQMTGFPTTSLYAGEAHVWEGAYTDILDPHRFVDHVFTHFKLKLYVAKVSVEYFNGTSLSASIDSNWVDYDQLDSLKLPTLFSKVRSIL
jgi:A/G-specific adenine glycosylase